MLRLTVSLLLSVDIDIDSQISFLIVVLSYFLCVLFMCVFHVTLCVRFYNKINE